MIDQARSEFELARDDDALDFRSDTRINSAIEEAASRHAGRGVYLLDAAKALEQSSPGKIPGLELFYEHVHLNFAGNYLLALNFAEQAKKFLPDAITARDKGNWASAELCDDRLAVTVWDRQAGLAACFEPDNATPISQDSSIMMRCSRFTRRNWMKRSPR